MKITKKIDVTIDTDGKFCSSRCLHHEMDLYCRIFRKELKKEKSDKFIKPCRCQECIVKYSHSFIECVEPKLI